MLEIILFFSHMNIILYKLTLNLKWFLSTLVGCLIAALFLILPMFFGSLHLMIFTGDFKLDFGWHLLQMVGMFSISFWFVGRGLKKYHPPSTWTTKRNLTLLNFVNILLILPPGYYVYSLLTVEYYYFHGMPIILSQMLSLPCLFLLILLNKKITNEDLEIAKQPTEPEQPVLPKDYLRRIRITVVILSVAMMVSIFFVVHSNIEADLANEQLDMERRWHQRELEELNTQIDSLTSELETLKRQSNDL